VAWDSSEALLADKVLMPGGASKTRFEMLLGTINKRALAGIRPPVMTKKVLMHR
jgi:hypothetical protein